MGSSGLYCVETQMYLLCVYSGCKDKAYGPILKELMQTTNFRVTVVEESDVVEICGALKVNLLWFPLSSQPRPKQQRFHTELLCFRCRTSSPLEPVSATAWALATTPRRQWSVLAWWRWLPLPSSSAPRALSRPPPSWRAVASPTSSQPATADATARSGRHSPKRAKYDSIYLSLCSQLERLWGKKRQ